MGSLEAVASAWRARVGTLFSCVLSDWRRGGRQRKTCGHCSVMVCLIVNAEVVAITQRLRELLRLLVIAARAGPDVFRLLRDDPTPCPFLSCAWCDDAANDDVLIAVRVFGGGTEGPKLLKEALFDWSETASVVSREYLALRDAMQALVVARQHAGQSIGVSLSLEPGKLKAPDDVLVYAEHTNQLLRAISTTDSPTTGFHVRRLTFHGSKVHGTPRELVPVLTTVLRYPIPVALDPFGTRHVSIATLTEACESGGASLEYLTDMTLQLDQAALQDEATVKRFCALLQGSRLERLSIDGSPAGDVEVQRRLLAFLDAALSGLKRLQDLRVPKLALRDAEMDETRAHGNHAEIPDMAPLSAESVQHGVLSNAVDVGDIVNAQDDARQTRERAHCCPALTKLFVSCDSSAQQSRKLLSKIGANLTEISLSSSLPSANHSEILEAIARCCPHLTKLSVDSRTFDEAFVRTLTSATDAGGFCLRKLSIDAECDANVAECVQLLQILSDPRRRLTQTLEDLLVFASKSTLSVVRQATDLMLRCNAQLKCVEISYSDEEEDDDDLYAVQGDEEEDDDLYAVQGDEEEDDDSYTAQGSDVQHDTAEFVASAAVRTMLEEMAVAADGKTATQQNVLSPGVVVLPSMRRRVAFLSVLVARDVSLPPPVVATVLLMAGRCPREHTSEILGLRYYTCINAGQHVQQV